MNEFSKFEFVKSEIKLTNQKPSFIRIAKVSS